MMAKSKQAYYGVQVADAFQQYKSEETTVQSRYLGVSSIKLGTQVFPFCIFYEITDSEISIVNRVKKVKLEQESDEDEIPLSPTALDCPAKTLPPKKRRKYLVQYEIIFSVEEGATPFSKDFTFYSLPQNAVTECLTETAPYKVLFSFYLGSTRPICCCDYNAQYSNEKNGVKTTLDEFADVCSTSCKLALPYPSNSEGHVLNMIISSVSHELHAAIKQKVHDYEMMCQNMVELMKLHSDKVAHHKSEMVFLPETAILPVSQSDDDYQTSKNNGWSSEEERTWDKDGNESSYEEPIKPKNSHKTSKANNSSNQGKKCLYCGSKSTPMWRRGPQGAGTLCNACGVKWKHGKILNGNDNAHTKHVNKRRKSSTSRHTVRKTNRKRNSHQEGPSEDYYNNEPLFTAPAKRESVDQRPPLWEGQSTSSSTSDSYSPLESSPTYTPSFPLLEQDRYKNREFLNESESLPVYVGEDAVEAAAVLALLKRS